MKRKPKHIILVILGIIVVSILCISIYKVRAQEPVEKRVSYITQQSVHDLKNDGWVYVFEIYYSEGNDNNLYLFDGYNLKYKELDGFFVPVIDKTSGEELYRVTPNYITLSISEKYKEDIININEFFNLKQFSNKISISDLKDLNLILFEKEYLVDIFNRTLNSTLKKERGNYYNSGFLNKVSIKSSDENMQGEWQLSYLIDFGYISEVNIEFITDTNEYLSDNPEYKNSFYNQKILEKINDIEKKIIKNQSFDELSNSISSMLAPSTYSSNNSILDLEKLLKKASDEVDN